MHLFLLQSSNSVKAMNQMEVREREAPLPEIGVWGLSWGVPDGESGRVPSERLAIFCFV